MKNTRIVSLFVCLAILSACGKSKETLNQTKYRTTPPNQPTDAKTIYASWDLGSLTSEDGMVMNYSLRIDKGIVTNFVTCKLGDKTATTYAQSKAEITATEIRVLETVQGQSKNIDSSTCAVSITKMNYRYQLKTSMLLNLTDESYVSQDLKRLSN